MYPYVHIYLWILFKKLYLQFTKGEGLEVHQLAFAV